MDSLLLSDMESNVNIMPERHGFINFLPSQQKVKRKTSLRTLRLERSPPEADKRAFNQNLLHQAHKYEAYVSF
jgi:hypothetical protein